MIVRNDTASNRPWYAWIVGPVFLLVLFVLAGLSIPYYLLNPHHHLHQWDLGPPHRQQRVAQWRALYAQAGVFGRLRRLYRRWRRR